MYEGNTFAEVYSELCQNLTIFGDEVSPRGKKTKEILQETFCINNPASNLVLFPGRKFSLMHAIAESVLLVTKTNELPCFSKFNKNMEAFSDDGKTLHGAYGYRISDSLKCIVKKLKEDKDSRQAVINVYRLRDLTDKSKDIPCTIALQFTIRDDALNMHVYMRSNDVVWGTPYDVFMFTNLQMVMANQLELKLGKYYHTATSFHAYEEHFELLSNMAFEGIIPVEHKNGNNLDEWIILGKTFAGACMTASPTFDDFNHSIGYGQKDMTYAELICMEMNYRNIFRAPDEFIRVAKYGLNDFMSEIAWASDFTSRWFND